MNDIIPLAKIIASLGVLPVAVYGIIEYPLMGILIFPLSLLVIVAIHTTTDGSSKAMRYSRRG